MTSPYTSSLSRPSLFFSITRAVFGLLIAAGTVVGALFVAWIAAITWSGCFISCTGTNHAGGAAIGAGALLSSSAASLPSGGCTAAVTGSALPPGSWAPACSGCFWCSG